MNAQNGLRKMPEVVQVDATCYTRSEKEE